MTHPIATSSSTYNTQRRAALDSFQNGQQMLYAMRVAGDLIKIGCSRDLAQRRKCLTGELLAIMPGDFDDELAIHHRLASSVHHGREWYNPTSEVLAVVNEIREYFHLEALAA